MYRTKKIVSDGVYAAFKELLFTGEIDFGDKINELEYCDKLDASRTPVREAIRHLEMEGIFQKTPEGKVKVIDINEKRIKEIYGIRIFLEDTVFDNITIDETLLLELENNLSLSEFQIKSKNWNEARKLFSEFERMLLNNADMEFTKTILKYYNFIIEKLRYNSLEKEQRILETHKEQLSILQCLKENNIEKAKTLNKDYLINSREIVLKNFVGKTEKTEK